MQTRRSHLKKSLLLSASSCFLAMFSSLLGQVVRYSDYLAIFNAIVYAILATSAIAFIIGLSGLWRTGGRKAALWLATAFPVLCVWLLVSYG